MNKIYTIKFRDSVYTEINDVYDWYELQSIGLGEKFIALLDETFESIRENPLLFIQCYKKFRKANMKTFPYLIFFEIEKQDIIIYRVIHSKRHPKSRFKA